jgi:formylglycine-generating enzyme required for sulfatase activity
MLTRNQTLGSIVPFLILLLAAGCDEDATSPETDPPATAGDPGTIVIEVEPDAIGAAWEIAGPGSFEGSGTVDSVMTDMPAGTYTITWTDVENWIAPVEETRTLPAEGMLVLAGFYAEVGFTRSEFVLVLGGNSILGSPLDELGARIDEHPQHNLHLTRGRFMQTTEVTNQQYLEMAQWAVDNGYATATDSILYDGLDGSEEVMLRMGASDSEIVYVDGALTLRSVGGHGLNPDHPVHHVTWYGAAAYCDWLSLKSGIARAYNHQTWECNEHDPYAAPGYRLPTEAEWEHACRAWTVTAFANGPITERFCGFDAVLDEVGWYCGNNVDGWSSAVGLKAPNALGLYDMHGNAWEWCNDQYRDDEYSGHGETAVDPAGPRHGYRRRVCRGGTWRYGAELCRSAARGAEFPITGGLHMGFRVVKSHWSFHLP